MLVFYLSFLRAQGGYFWSVLSISSVVFSVYVFTGGSVS